MNTVQLKKGQKIFAWVFATAFLFPTVGAASIDAGLDWQPVVSESLIRMPAKYLNSSIERDFQKSTLASGLSTLETQLMTEVSKMQSMMKNLKTVEGEANAALRHDLLLAKSNYLELMSDKQSLKKRALNKKSGVYQKVLSTLQQKRLLASDPVSASLVASQKSARERMNRVVADVDELLLQNPFSKVSSYQKEYGVNLAKIEQLKQAINKHKGSENPILNGQTLNREQYIRFLQSNVESDLALLDQEQLMLGYMAKLVALDAQSLEHELEARGNDGRLTKPLAQARLMNTVDLFLGQ